MDSPLLPFRASPRSVLAFLSVALLVVFALTLLASCPGLSVSGQHDYDGGPPEGGAGESTDPPAPAEGDASK